MVYKVEFFDDTSSLPKVVEISMVKNRRKDSAFPTTSTLISLSYGVLQMTNKPQIDLSLNQAGIIVVHNSGVIYHNQTCGVVCMQRYQEGVLLLPTDPELVKGAPIETYQCPIEFGLKAMQWWAVTGIDNVQADAIDALLKAYPYTRTISVDRSCLHLSEEAWVYVILEPDGILYSGFDNRTGILVWNNSD